MLTRFYKASPSKLLTPPLNVLFAGLSLFFVFALVDTTQAQLRDKNQKPNIVVLYADDMGYGDLGIQNSASKIPTPNLDKLARQGVRFSDAHSSSGICTPSRYALLTGRYHWRDFHNIVGPFGRPPFPPNILTMPSFLRKHDYQTACVGKWHLGFHWDKIKKKDAQFLQKKNRKIYRHDAFQWDKPIPGGPLDRGFTYFFGNTAINMPPYCWIKNDKVLNAPDQNLNAADWPKPTEGHWEFRPGPTYSGWNPRRCLERTTEEAVNLIKSQSQKETPFFLYVPFPSPHAPIIPNKKFRGSSDAGAYGDYVHQTDDACGRILKALKEQGLEENTIVIFTSDNGPEVYAYRREEKHHHWSSGPLRGLKRDIYEGGHRVPFIVRWPGQTPKGKTCHALISQIDLFSTFAEIVGESIPENQAVDSKSFLACLKNPESETRNVIIHNTFPGRYAIRKGPWLLLDKGGYGSRKNLKWEKRNGYSKDASDNLQLYRLDKDLAQRHNLQSKYPKIAQELKTELHKTVQELKTTRNSSN